MKTTKSSRRVALIPKFLCGAVLCSAVTAFSLQAATLADVLPGHVRDPALPTPQAALGFAPGEWHMRPEQLVSYYQQLATQSPRVSVRVIGYTHERRPLLNVIITSPENQARLADIEAARARGDQDTPVIAYLGYSIHGNEPSGANAAPSVAWHLASSQDASVTGLLSRTVVIIDPMLNPDGMARFASWVNSYRGQTLSSDPQTLEHRESWPASRGNHYWFDLNRDWLWLQHPESQARIAVYQKWRPHVLGDFHEQGTDATYFFQPGIPSRTHPLTPEKNQQLTAALAQFHARALDARGELYFSREAFDDFYYGKGSTYPDIQGSVGILFEQASSRGHVQQSRNGLLRFEHTISNQFSTSLSLLQGVDALRDQLMAHQQQFYEDAMQAAKADGARAFLFAAENNPARLRDFAHLLQQHGIAVHRAKTDASINGKRYAARDLLAVPVQQRQYRLLQAITELRTQFRDPTFYDVSAWSLTQAYDLASEKTSADLIGERFDPRSVNVAAGDWQESGAQENGSRSTGTQEAGVAGSSVIAYAFDWRNDDAAPLLSDLVQAGLRTRVASKPLRLRTADGVQEFPVGSIVVPVTMQSLSPNALLDLLRKVSTGRSLRIHAVQTAAGEGGIDLGSASLKSIDLPRVVLLTGNGLDSTSVGELWHWLDTHLKLPVTQVPVSSIGELPLEKYTHLVMADGRYRFSEEQGKRLEQFVRQGGVIIGMDGAVNGLSPLSFVRTKPVKNDSNGKNGADRNAAEKAGTEKVSAEKTSAENGKPATRSDERRPYSAQEADAAKDRIAGAILRADVDRSHPLAAGLPRDQVPVFRAHNDAFRVEGNRYATVAAYSAEPVVSGYVSADNAKKLAGTAMLSAERVGAGSVILTTASLSFRSGWPGSRRLLDNALFFGRAFDRPGDEGDDEEDAH